MNAGDLRSLADTTRVTTRHGLVGLAFSGGGIRSAAFSLGVAQHFIATGLWSTVDYLSTVSGGGYTGACLSALTSAGGCAERLLVERGSDGEPPALNHLRNGSNYLVSQGIFNQLQLPALFIAGATHTFLLFLPLVILGVLFTEVFFEVTGHILIDSREWLAVLGVVPLLAAVLTRPMRTGRSKWEARDRADRRLGGYLLLAGLSLLAVPALDWLGQAVNNDAAWVFENIAGFVREQRALGPASWALWMALAAIVAFAAGAARWRVRFLVPIIGALGPLALMAVYILACIYAINSPLSKDPDDALRTDIARYRAAPDNEQAMAALTADLRRLLLMKQIESEAYELDWTRLQQSGELVLDRRRRAPRMIEWFTTHAIPRLHIRFDSGWWSRFSESPHLIVIEELAILRGHAEWWLYLAGLLIGVYNYWFVNINRISMHGFYRDRLSRTFLLRPCADPDGGPVAVVDELRLSQLGDAQSAAPYHLINTSLNLQGSVDPQLRERKTVPFVLSQRWCGSPYTGYLRTTDVEAIDPSFDLGTAVAISAAAASPNMGAVTVRPLTFLLALLNVRLNYWLPNPAWAWSESWATRVRDSRLGIGYLLAEAFGHTDRHRPFVNCSDGAHIENLGVYELLRRRCQTVICVDAECDPGFTFCGFVNLQRYAEIDLGATIAIDLRPVRPNAEGISCTHHAVGTIRYRDGEQGVFHYLKLSTTGDEPEYLRYYRLESPTFPHEGTSDQFFDETQFEAYRALGRHVAEHDAGVPSLAVGLS